MKILYNMYYELRRNDLVGQQHPELQLHQLVLYRPKIYIKRFVLIIIFIKHN